MLNLTTKLALALIPGAIALAFSVPLQADTPPGLITTQSISVIPTDTSSEPQLFIDEAGQFFVRETQMGEMALQKSGNVQVQAYARMILDHNARLEIELNNVARQVNAAPPKQRLILPDLQAKIGALQGADFDRAYMSASVSDHQAAIANFQNEGLAHDPRGINLKPLSDWAAKSVSTLNDELTQGQSLSESVGSLKNNGAQEP